MGTLLCTNGSDCQSEDREGKGDRRRLRTAGVSMIMSRAIDKTRGLLGRECHGPWTLLCAGREKENKIVIEGFE
jgi:hypothetical protein